MKITVEEFFGLLVAEVRENASLQGYYKFKDSDSSSFYFRKSYFCQRLEYIKNYITENDKLIWDCGCGYGTTAIFLALNGYTVYGSTLEFYYGQIENRLKYWSKFGNLSKLSFGYENIFDNKMPQNTYDIIIGQDTFHHLEPLNDAISIFSKVLKPDGKIIAIEENGMNIIQNLKLYLRRGNKRIITIYDETLKKEILLGNENIRGIKQWQKEFNQYELYIENSSIQYVRLFPPIFISEKSYLKMINHEQQFWKSSRLLRNRFFFGLNFIVKKKI